MTAKLTQKQIKQELARKPVSHAKPALPPKAISEVLLIDLERIEVSPQARTQFDDITIQELAGDIEANGLLQPVLVSPIGDEKYRLVCGERRLRAIRKLGQKYIPALVSKIADGNALAIQLAENIQREDMTLKDLAQAVRQLYDELKDLQAVSLKVGKSKSWVCKHVAAATNYGYRTKALLESGTIEDIELLGTLAKIEEVAEYYVMGYAIELVRQGSLNRQQARDFLKEVKAGRDPRLTPEKQIEQAEREKKRQEEEARKLAEREARRAAAEAEDKAIKEGSDERFIEWAMMELSDRLDQEESNSTWFLNELRQDQRDTLQKHLEDLAQANQREKALQFWKEQLFCSGFNLRDSGRYCNDLERMAVIIGMIGQKPELYALVALAETEAEKGLK